MSKQGLVILILLSLSFLLWVVVAVAVADHEVRNCYEVDLTVSGVGYRLSDNYDRTIKINGVICEKVR